MVCPHLRDSRRTVRGPAGNRAVVQPSFGGEAMMHASFKRSQVRNRMCTWGVLAGMVFGQAGCMHQQTRLQSADEPEKDRYELKTVGDVSSIGNAEPVALAGVGLMVGLDGTGGESPP